MPDRSEKSNQSRARQQTGRYRDIERAAVPGELPPEGRVAAQVLIHHGSVQDPNTALRGKRQRVAINQQTDALEYEYGRGRISEAAYWAGRCYQSLLERSRIGITGCSSFDPGNRVDQVIAHEISLLNKIARAQDVVAMLNDTRPAIGKLGEAILVLVLIEGLTIKAAAQRLCGSSQFVNPKTGAKAINTNQVFFWGETFRTSLDALADHWCGPRAKAPRAGL